MWCVVPISTKRRLPLPSDARAGQVYEAVAFQPAWSAASASLKPDCSSGSDIRRVRLQLRWRATVRHLPTRLAIISGRSIGLASSSAQDADGLPVTSNVFLKSSAPFDPALDPDDEKGMLSRRLRRRCCSGEARSRRPATRRSRASPGHCSARVLRRDDERASGRRRSHPFDCGCGGRALQRMRRLPFSNRPIVTPINWEVSARAMRVRAGRPSRSRRCFSLGNLARCCSSEVQGCSARTSSRALPSGPVGQSIA